MKARQLIMFSAASGVLVTATPALAQPEMTYEQQRQYEYAQPAAPAVSAPMAPPRVVYRQEEVVQPIPQNAAYDDGYGADYEAPSYAAPAYSAPHIPQATMPHHAAYPGPVTYPGQASYPQHHSQMPQPPQFDRNAWLEECVARYNGGELRRDRHGNIIGGLIGAAAGGVIGNRVAKRGDRLAGSLIGAGIGGLAGLAVGAVIDAATDKRDDDFDGEAWGYCEDYLSRYSHQNTGGYGYYYPQQMMWVPIMVQVPQRAVVREYVTEETYNVQVVTYEDVPRRRRVIQRDKRVPVKQTPIKRTRSVKGN